MGFKLAVDKNGKIINTNLFYHNKCFVDWLLEFILGGNKKIIGVDDKKNCVEIPLQTDCSSIDLMIKGSNRKFACDVLAHTYGNCVYIEIVNTNRSILQWKKKNIPKMEEYKKRKCLVVLVDVRPLLKDCIKNFQGDLDELKNLFLKCIAGGDKRDLVSIIDWREDIFTIDASAVTFKNHIISDTKNFVRIKKGNDELIVSKTTDAFVVDEITKKFKGKTVIVSNKYDKNLSVDENLVKMNIF